MSDLLPATDVDGAPRKSESVGLILVHGIGEQRRFEHLDGQLRFLIRALHGLKLRTEVQDVSVDTSPRMPRHSTPRLTPGTQVPKPP